eukprot:gnl/MRDRNA2_/MRDRNA2_157102_c0_seq1.p1 gnl/MRDRNA2_/MRDRNA2_157102_c0~~gnl/MRDRNA2_/MRDRNA2_157102_c0_seq1.p1  ORF type:complete len:134 (-),score=24.23 gnl/MRDRNA2_/MRDRNA2_157102_c0_seq1:46-447(-)
MFALLAGRQTRRLVLIHFCLGMATKSCEFTWPDRWAFKTENGEMDVPALDLHLMRMLGQSQEIGHRDFFTKMAAHYGFTGGPFGDPDTLLRVMTEMSLRIISPSELADILEQNHVAMGDTHFRTHVRQLRDVD